MIDNWMTSPDRMKWVTRKERKRGKCVFCRIAAGDHNVESLVLWQNSKFMVLMNLYPYNTGHIQVIPVRHVKSFEELTDKEISEMFILVKKSMKMLKKVLKPIGFNAGFNQGGSAAGASIEHIHFHIVPRYKTDFGFMDIVGGTKVLPEPVESTYKRLKSHIDMLE